MPLVTQGGEASSSGKGGTAPNQGWKDPDCGLLEGFGSGDILSLGLGFPWGWQCDRQTSVKGSVGRDVRREHEGLGGLVSSGCMTFAAARPPDPNPHACTHLRAAPGRPSCTQLHVCVMQLPECAHTCIHTQPSRTVTCTPARTPVPHGPLHTDAHMNDRTCTWAHTHLSLT